MLCWAEQWRMMIDHCRFHMQIIGSGTQLTAGPEANLVITSYLSMYLLFLFFFSSLPFGHLKTFFLKKSSEKSLVFTCSQLHKVLLDGYPLLIMLFFLAVLFRWQCLCCKQYGGHRSHCLSGAACPDAGRWHPAAQICPCWCGPTLEYYRGAAGHAEQERTNQRFAFQIDVKEIVQFNECFICIKIGYSLDLEIFKINKSNSK